MKLPRRQFLHLAAGAVALPVASRAARAQAYPARPVRIIVGFPAGGTVDILARLMGQWLQERVGQPVVVENRPGAGGNIATETVTRAPADGYTLLAACSPNAINASLYDKLPFNFIRDMVPIAGTVRLANVMVVNPLVPAKTVREFIAYAKANPGKLSIASAGNGTSGHLAGELFKMMTGLDLVHVPYRGGPPALTDLIGGRVHVLFDVIPNSIEHIRTGKVRVLAVTTAERSEALPDVPPIREVVPSYEVSFWNGLAAPKGTPAQIVEKLNREINAALSDPKIAARLVDLGGTALPLSSSDFARLIADDTEKWAKVIKFAAIKPA